MMTLTYLQLAKRTIFDHINLMLLDWEPAQVLLATLGCVLLLWITWRVYGIEDKRRTSMVMLIRFAQRFIPGVKSKIDATNAKLLVKIENSLPRIQGERFTSLPAKGVPQDQVLQMMDTIRRDEEHKWQSGHVSGAVYVGDEAHTQLMNRAYSLFSLTNPLHPDVFPSVRKFEAEVISMTVHMLGGGEGTTEAPEACGAMTSGGTESIIMALKAYRDQARAEKPHIRVPEVIVPTSVHCAFDKGCNYLGLKLVKAPLRSDFTVDVEAVRRSINRNTILVVGSAPCFPYGTIDSIPALAALAQRYRIGCHVDCCLGGFILPWAKRLGYQGIPDFDFRVPGVTSISADTHKYGYTVKGTSTILYRTKQLRRYMYYCNSDWIGGMYASPTIGGSRPGGLIAACWAAMVSLGEDGYTRITDEVLRTTMKIRDGINAIPGLRVLGQPSSVIVAFTSDDVDILKVVVALHDWSLNVLQFPKCVHICVTPRHVQSADQFLADLQNAVNEVRNNPTAFKDGTASVYGFAAALPDRDLVKNFISSFVDALYKT